MRKPFTVLVCRCPKTKKLDEGHTALHRNGALIKVTLHDGPDGCSGRMAGKIMSLMNAFLSRYISRTLVVQSYNSK